ncbi:MAG TPA: polysaccharide biosynthesis/export family protein [Chroococcales cyanobacterium]
MKPGFFSRIVASTSMAALLLSAVPQFAFASTNNQSLKSLTPKIDQSSAPVRAPAIAQNTTSPIRAFKLNAGITQEYVLGPGDVMSITDLSSDGEQPDTSLSPVLPDGTAIISYAGIINAAGMSLRQINELVNEKAKQFFVNPSIVVNLAKQRATQVYLLGELQHPGLYSPDAKGGGDEAKASSGGKGGDEADASGGSSGIPTSPGVFTLAAALELAGGLKQTADVRHIHVTRLHPKQVIDVDLWKLMLDGDVSEDLVLQPGDVVYVPKGGSEFNVEDFGKVVNNAPKVRVMGAVSSPGLVTMAGDDDLISVIARAGGFSKFAASKYIYLSRTNRDGTVSTEKINYGKSIKNGSSMGRMKVHPGDVISVRTSPTKIVGYSLGRYTPQMLMSVMLYSLLQNGGGH